MFAFVCSEGIPKVCSWLSAKIVPLANTIAFEWVLSIDKRLETWIWIEMYLESIRFVARSLACIRSMLDNGRKRIKRSLALGILPRILLVIELA